MHSTEYEWNSGISETVPNEAMTMRDIITKFSRTGQVDGRMQRKEVNSENPSFDDHDMEELQRMDLYDRQELAAQIRAERESKLEQLKQNQKIFEEEKQQKEKEKTFSTSSKTGKARQDADDQDTEGVRGTSKRTGKGGTTAPGAGKDRE